MNPPPTPPAAGQTFPGDPREDPAAHVTTDRACIRCSYNLRGLPTDGTCPECGTPVEQSLRGHYLAFAAPEYVASLRSGVGLVLAGILSYLVALFGGVVAGITLAAWLSPALLMGLRHAALLIPTLLLIMGYWRFTRPDPSLVDREAPASARRIIRISVVIHAGAAVAGTVAAAGGPGGIAPPGFSSLYAVLAILLDLAAFVAWIAQFFAAMAYVGWLGRRVPDRVIVDRCGYYSWVLPVLFVLGAIVLLIGPVVAIGLYWSLLDRLRRQLRAIERTGMPMRGT